MEMYFPGLEDVSFVGIFKWRPKIFYWHFVTDLSLYLSTAPEEKCIKQAWYAYDLKAIWHIDLYDKLPPIWTVTMAMRCFIQSWKFTKHL